MGTLDPTTGPTLDELPYVEDRLIAEICQIIQFEPNIHQICLARAAIRAAIREVFASPSAADRIVNEF